MLSEITEFKTETVTLCYTFVCVRDCKTKKETKNEGECVCACIKQTRERSLRQPEHLLSHL